MLGIRGHLPPGHEESWERGQAGAVSLGWLLTAHRMCRFGEATQIRVRHDLTKTLCAIALGT